MAGQRIWVVSRAPKNRDVKRFQVVGSPDVTGSTRETGGTAGAATVGFATSFAGRAGTTSKSASLKSFRITLTRSRDSSVCTGARVTRDLAGFVPDIHACRYASGFNFLTRAASGVRFFAGTTTGRFTGAGATRAELTGSGCETLTASTASTASTAATGASGAAGAGCGSKSECVTSFADSDFAGAGAGLGASATGAGALAGSGLVTSGTGEVPNGFF